MEHDRAIAHDCASAGKKLDTFTCVPLYRQRYNFRLSNVFNRFVVICYRGSRRICEIPIMSIKKLPQCVIVLFLLASNAVFAQADKDPNYAKGQALAGVCSGCHGADGHSTVPTQPSLAGMAWQYTARQLKHFKTGQRDNAIMKGFVANLSDADMKALGVYYAAQKPRSVGTKDLALAKTAEKLYRAGDASRAIPACAGCHSPTGAGIPAQYPRLGGQHAEYTLAQLAAFKSGARGKATKEDAHPNGKMMMTIASKLTDAEMKALAEYTAGLKAN
jgi:cytochrome c553